jgi:hypothetical protein
MTALNTKFKRRALLSSLIVSSLPISALASREPLNAQHLTIHCVPFDEEYYVPPTIAEIITKGKKIRGAFLSIRRLLKNLQPKEMETRLNPRVVVIEPNAERSIITSEGLIYRAGQYFLPEARDLIVALLEIDRGYYGCAKVRSQK